jgi:hypothetical protein
MRDERCSRIIALLLSLSLCLTFTIVGCDSGGDGKSAKVAPEAEKKTQDMLNNIQQKMKDLHKGEGKASRKGR